MNPTRLFVCVTLGLLCAAAPAPAKAKHAAPKKSVKAPVSAKPSAPQRSTLTPLAPVSEWMSKDVGKVGRPGSSLIQFGPHGNAVTVYASGEDIFGKADSFRFTSRPMTGDGQIVACVLAYQRQDQWTKVGVMVREGDAPGAKFADLVLTPDHGAEFQWRTQTEGETQTSDQTPAPAPYWVKLTRTGDVFVGSISKDGKVWTERGRATVPMAASVLVGVCVTSHKNDTLTQARLDSVVVGAGGW